MSFWGHFGVILGVSRINVVARAFVVVIVLVHRTRFLGRVKPISAIFWGNAANRYTPGLFITFSDLKFYSVRILQNLCHFS